jgi:hypothetical protein
VEAVSSIRNLRACHAVVTRNPTNTACSTNVGEWNAYRILVVKPERKRPKTKTRLEDNIKMDLREDGIV